MVDGSCRLFRCNGTVPVVQNRSIKYGMKITAMVKLYSVSLVNEIYLDETGYSSLLSIYSIATLVGKYKFKDN